MGEYSAIEWTGCTWNPVTGCTKISAGCMNCYAERMALRLQEMGQPRYSNGFRVTCHDDVLALPLRWRKPHLVFSCSMADLFHEEVPEAFIQRVFGVMKRAEQHRFQILTKRSQRLGELAGVLTWTRNIWMGVTVERADYVWRMDPLRQTGAAVKFLSMEPLLGPVPGMDLGGIDWVIVGGESGPGARPIEEDWVLDIRDQCLAHDVCFCFKQWGGVRKEETGRLLQGRTWDEMPDVDHAQQLDLLSQ